MKLCFRQVSELRVFYLSLFKPEILVIVINVIMFCVTFHVRIAAADKMRYELNLFGITNLFLAMVNCIVLYRDRRTIG